MALALGICGITTIFIGLGLIGLGAYMAWQEESERRKQQRAVRGAADVLNGLAALADALAKHPVGIRFIFLGVLLVIFGGVIGGVGGLV